MKFRILIQSFENELIKKTCEQINIFLTATDCQIGSIISLPTKIKRFCVLRSPHVDKDSREHFEIRVYKRIISFSTISPYILDQLLNLDLSAGISCSLKIIND